MHRSTHRVLILSAALLAPAAPLIAQGDQVETCASPLGTLAVVEPEAQAIQSLSGYGLGSPGSLIRMMVQKSNCFLVVERGAGLETLQRERELARSGELQQGSNLGGGQMVAADFVLTPGVLFSEGNAGGVGGALGGFLGRRTGLGAVLGGLKFKEAQTSMLVSDTRTGVQVAAAEGNATRTDFNFAALGFGGGALSAMGGYTNTNEGKVIAASFLDNFNRIVLAVRDHPGLSAAGGPAPGAGAVGFAAGDVAGSKIDDVPLLAKPSDAAGVVATLKRADEVVVLGAPQDGFVQVQGAAGAGWVKLILLEAR